MPAREIEFAIDLHLKTYNYMYMYSSGQKKFTFYTVKLCKNVNFFGQYCTFLQLHYRTTFLMYRQIQ